MKKVYEFNITILGEGFDVDEAFSDALDFLSRNPDDAIQQEVIYVVKKGVIKDESSESDSKE